MPKNFKTNIETGEIQLDDGRIILSYEFNMGTGELINWYAQDWNGNDNVLNNWNDDDVMDEIYRAYRKGVDEQTFKSNTDYIRAYFVNDEIEGQYIKDLIVNNPKTYLSLIEKYCFELAADSRSQLYGIEMREASIYDAIKFLIPHKEVYYGNN